MFEYPLERILVPLADPNDAKRTAHALRPYVEPGSEVVVTHVVEKAGGAPDKASVEQREAFARETFRAVAGELGEVDLLLETRLRYGTDVAERIVQVADDEDASAIVFTPRGGSRWVKLISGDVTHDLFNETDRPVIVLPNDGEREVNAK